MPPTVDDTQAVADEGPRQRIKAVEVTKVQEAETANDMKAEMTELRQQARDFKHILDQLMSSLSKIENQLPLTKHKKAESVKDGGGLSQKHLGKVFRMRESRLTELLKVDDFRTVYNIFLALLCILSVSVASQHWLKHDDEFSWNRFMDQTVIRYAFGKQFIVAATWLVLFVYSLLSYVWMPVMKNAKGVVPYVLTLYAACQVGIMMFAGYACLSNDLPPASGFIVMIEATRIAMKVHSFMRFMLQCQLDNSGSDVDLSQTVFSSKNTFRHYVYFMFSPTMLYRPEYPYNTSIRWSFAAQMFVEVLGIVLYMAVIFQQYCIPQFRDTGKHPDSLRTLVNSLFNSMLPGMTVFLVGFFGLLHSWLNGWAELLQFGDRQFYRSWWNSTSFGEYYRLWNTPVHDWLYTHVYLDTCSALTAVGLSASASKSVASLIVIEFSAVIHEYIIACATGFCFPALAIMFGGPGVVFTFMNSGRDKSNTHNIFFWAMMIVGMGLLVMLYSREYYARLFVFGGDSVCGQPEVKFGTWPYWQRFFSVFSFSSM